ncbi:ORF3 [Barthadenovirus mellis]|uniref:ORF3 n=1 Tax=Passerine adenovirus 1 TaxID=2779174 RepID=A0A7L9DHY3_9ADEN|nr:ORF3 [Passerine adenovirus 1]
MRNVLYTFIKKKTKSPPQKGELEKIKRANYVTTNSAKHPAQIWMTFHDA